MWVLARNLGEILREFGEILGKYRILDNSSLGSKGLKKVPRPQFHSKYMLILSIIYHGGRSRQLGKGFS